MAIEVVETATEGGEVSTTELIEKQLAGGEEAPKPDGEKLEEEGRPDGEKSSEEEGKEGVEGEGESKKPVKVDAETRVQEALQRAKEADSRAKKLEAEFAEMQKQQAEAVKPYKELSLAEVEDVVAAAEEEIAQLRAEGNRFQAALAQRKLDEYLAFVVENEKKREEFEAEQVKKTASKTELDKRIAAYNQAQEFYREKRQIPKETWEAAGKWLADFFKENELEGRKFVEILERRGPMAAFEHGEELVTRHFAGAVKKAKEEKEKAKGVNIGGSGAASSTKKSPEAMSNTEYFKMREEQIKKRK